jgi:hypothetical protein
MKFLSQTVIMILALSGARGAERLISVPPGFGNSATLYPFLILQEQTFSMRYQQVYGANAFSALEPTDRYLTRLCFPEDENAQGAMSSPTNLEIRLSTTSKAPDALSTNFAENVGPDETVVFASADPQFTIPNPDHALVLTLPKPFVYTPAKGNLLLDVRIQTAGLAEPFEWWLDAQADPGDAISRAYAKSADATAATVMDTVGVCTVFQFDSVPSLHIYTSRFGTPTNWFAIEWPTQPTVFRLQTATQLGSNANWQTITNDTGGPNASFQRYYFPVESAGLVAFFRLVWEGGQISATTK